MLAAEDASATVFVVAGAVGSARPFWWDRLAALIYDGDGTGYWSAWERLSVSSGTISPRDPRSSISSQKALRRDAELSG